MSELPEGWTRTSLEEIGNWCSGGTPSRKKTEYFGKGIPWIKSGDLTDGLILQTEEQITELGLKNSSAKLMPAGTISMALYGATIGKLGVITFPAATNQACVNVIPESRLIDGDYLFFYLMSERRNLIEKAQGGAQPNISQEIVRSYPVVIAPLFEQRRIVAKLEKLLAKVEACQQRLAKIPMILKRFRRAVLAAACSGRLTVDWREMNSATQTASALLQRIKAKRLELASSQKEINLIYNTYAREESFPSITDDIPVTWLSCTVGAIGTVINGSTPSRKVSEYWGEDIHWVSSGEVRNNLIWDTREKITEDGYQNSSVRLLSPGTVLLAMIGEGKTRGQTAILKVEATINQNIAAVILDHNLLLPEYLWFWFQLQYEATRESGSGSGPQALNCQTVRELPFVLPPLAEQCEIVRRIEALFKFADQIEDRYQKANAQVDKLTQSILAKAFRGELVLTEAELARREGRDYEPASVLLERIRTERARQQKEKKPKLRSQTRQQRKLIFLG